MSVLVSIVIPVYNAIPYLNECLASVKSQTFSNYEVIMVNDGSTDDSEEILHAYANMDSRFKVYNQENHGLGYTRNRGISLSQGKYLFFLDADDSIPAKAIESLFKAADKLHADYAVGKVVRFNESRKYIPIRHLEFNLYHDSGSTTLSAHPEMLQDSIACNKLWRKSLIVENGLTFKEGKYYEDLNLTMKAAVLAKKIEVINEVVYHWRVRGDEDAPSITQQQMKLNNTLHRLEALQENRHWLEEMVKDKNIIEQNDLKSLYDIIRLHALKYALIEEKDREEWESTVLRFLSSISKTAALQLPPKEKKIYDFLINKDYSNLLLFSRMLTDSERESIVSQDDGKFILNGFGKRFEITHFLKPTVIIGTVSNCGPKWLLDGFLTVPKASLLMAGELYAQDRATGEKIICGNFETEQVDDKAIYPFENQTFTSEINEKIFQNYKKKAVFDFYYRLKDYPEIQPARVRLPFTSIIKEEKLTTGYVSLKLYGTNYGNLSMTLQVKRKKKILDKYFRFLTRK